MQGTIHFGIHYVANFDLDLVGFSDSYWESDSTNRKYTYGYIFMIGTVPTRWSSKNKAVISLSSLEA